MDELNDDIGSVEIYSEGISEGGDKRQRGQSSGEQPDGSAPTSDGEQPSSDGNKPEGQGEEDVDSEKKDGQDKEDKSDRENGEGGENGEGEEGLKDKDKKGKGEEEKPDEQSEQSEDKKGDGEPKEDGDGGKDKEDSSEEKQDDEGQDKDEDEEAEAICHTFNFLRDYIGVKLVAKNGNKLQIEDEITHFYFYVCLDLEIYSKFYRKILELLDTEKAISQTYVFDMKKLKTNKESLSELNILDKRILQYIILRIKNYPQFFYPKKGILRYMYQMTKPQLSKIQNAKGGVIRTVKGEGVDFSIFYMGSGKMAILSDMTDFKMIGTMKFIVDDEKLEIRIISNTLKEPSGVLTDIIHAGISSFCSIIVPLLGKKENINKYNIVKSDDIMSRFLGFTNLLDYLI